MAITDKTRKFFWAKSGSRCSICKIELITNRNENEEFNIGEECHIISSKKKEPRHKENLSDYDNYDNLVLLCKNHHKEVDELVETYNEEVLRYIKINHENWVKQILSNELNNVKDKNIPKFLSRITSGKELFNIIYNTHGFRTDYDDVKNSNELEIISCFFGTLFEYADNSEMYEIRDKIKIGLDLQILIEDLENSGYYVFAERIIETMFSNDPNSEKWSIAAIIIKKKENPDIIKINV